jgi:hypothetical protein
VLVDDGGDLMGKDDVSAYNVCVSAGLRTTNEKKGL